MIVRPGVQALRLLRAVLVAAGIAMYVLSYPASAQSPKARTEGGQELRVLYATAGDVAEGKRVASDACARCHGANGISNTKAIPHLAGQRPAYLYAKLRAYQTGARKNREMEGAVKFLNDDALLKVAAFYSTLEPVQMRVTADTRNAAAKADPLAAGKAAAAPCGGCHGETGVTKNAGTPNLAGLDPKYFLAAMTAYKSGQRKHDVMKSMSAALGESDLKNVAFYFALQKPARAQTKAAGDQGAGKAATAACAGCHGEGGVSGSPANPSVAGQDSQYLVTALHAYMDGSRKDETMKGIAGALDEAAMKNIGAYYAAQEPKPPKVDKPLSLAEWAQRCDRCHGVNGNSTDPRSPALASQRSEYIEKVLHEYQSGARKDSVMAAMAASLDDAAV